MTESEKPSTFERSCDHWSERGKVGMDAFYRLAAIDYKLLAQQISWGELFATVQEKFGTGFRLLDVACGSGQFPDALLKYGELEKCPGVRVEYSLLDPSEYSIHVARQKLSGPFEPAEELLETVQDLTVPAGLYSVVWATHALYCVPPEELGVAIDRMIAAMDPGGLGFIAHASQDSHYLKFHDLYLQTGQAGDPLPYCTGEHVIDVLKRKRVPGGTGSEDLAHWSIEYEGTVALEDEETAELYLQRCLFDDQISLREMLATQPLCGYLKSCQDEASGKWRFKQKTYLIFYGDLARFVRRISEVTSR